MLAFYISLSFLAQQEESSEVAPVIKVEPSRALMDVPLSIELSGFPSNRPVTVTATQIYQTGSRWRAHYGRIDVGRQAPISGDYEGVAAMGLIWSARLVRRTRMAQFSWSRALMIRCGPQPLLPT